MVARPTLGVECEGASTSWCLPRRLELRLLPCCPPGPKALTVATTAEAAALSLQLAVMLERGWYQGDWQYVRLRLHKLTPLAWVRMGRVTLPPTTPKAPTLPVPSPLQSGRP